MPGRLDRIKLEAWVPLLGLCHFEDKEAFSKSLRGLVSVNGRTDCRSICPITRYMGGVVPTTLSIRANASTETDLTAFEWDEVLP